MGSLENCKRLCVQSIITEQQKKKSLVIEFWYVTWGFVFWPTHPFQFSNEKIKIKFCNYDPFTFFCIFFIYFLYIFFECESRFYFSSYQFGHDIAMFILCNLCVWSLWPNRISVLNWLLEYLVLNFTYI